MRIFLTALFLTLVSSPAWACSCGSWEGGLVSKFVGDYKSFWGVPVESKLKARSSDRPGLIVSYKVEVLEDYNRILKKEIEVTSSIADGGSCGVQLTIGVTQFLSAYEYEDGKLGLSSCTPYLPYKALKNYLEKGEDVFVPSESVCFDEKGNIDTENLDCVVWTDASFSPWHRQGEIDQLYYYQRWRAQKETYNPK